MISCHPRITNLGLPAIYGIGWGAKLAATGPSPHPKQLSLVGMMGMDIITASPPPSPTTSTLALPNFYVAYVCSTLGGWHMPHKIFSLPTACFGLHVVFACFGWHVRKKSLEMNLGHWCADCGLWNYVGWCVDVVEAEGREGGREEWITERLNERKNEACKRGLRSLCEVAIKMYVDGELVAPN